jgi:ferrous iron transport protein B
VGNPNSGKSTLFNRLTGLRQRTGNYPGVTVEKHTGVAKLDDAVVELVDLPGTFSLGAHSIEEHIAVDVVFGRMTGMAAPQGILAVVAMNNLYQGLFLVHQLNELGLPVLVALTMTDTAQAAGVQVDIEALERHLGGAKVCPVVATTGQGLPDLRRALAALPAARPPRLPAFWPELREVASRLAAESNGALRTHEVERELIDDSGLTNFTAGLDERLPAWLQEARAPLFNGAPPVAEEAQRRYN